MNDRNETTEELLDKIVFGEHSENEIAELIPAEEREAFLRELLLHRSATAIIQRHSVMEQVKTAQETFLQNYRQAKKDDGEIYKRTGRNIVRLFIGVAAAFIVTCSIIVLYWYNNTTGDKLFAERYKPYRVNVERSDDAAVNEKSVAGATREKMVTAANYLQAKRYNDAATVLKNIISQNLLTGNRLYHDEAEYYLALAYLKQKEYNKAYQLFDKIYIDKEHTFNGEVSWWFLTRMKWLK